MSVLVTGATGRIGSRVVSSLLSRNISVQALCLPDDPDAAFLEADGVSVVRGSLLDVRAVARAVADVDTVFHLGAALTTRGETSRTIVDSIALGTFNLVDVIRRTRHGDVRVVMASSTSVYQSARQPAVGAPPPNEAMAPSPSSPYGAAKISAELLLGEGARRGVLSAIIARPCDTADPTEIIDEASVFGRRWFVAGALRWHDRAGAGSVDTLPEEAYPQLRSAPSTKPLYSVRDRSGGEPMIQINDVSGVATAVIELADATGTEGEVIVVNLVPKRIWPMSEFVAGVATLIRVDPAEAILHVEVASPARRWVFDSIHPLASSRPDDVLTAARPVPNAGLVDLTSSDRVENR